MGIPWLTRFEPLTNFVERVARTAPSAIGDRLQCLSRRHCTLAVAGTSRSLLPAHRATSCILLLLLLVLGTAPLPCLLRRWSKLGSNTHVRHWSSLNDERVKVIVDLRRHCPNWEEIICHPDHLAIFWHCPFVMIYVLLITPTVLE